MQTAVTLRYLMDWIWIFIECDAVDFFGLIGFLLMVKCHMVKCLFIGLSVLAALCSLSSLELKMLFDL